jgi:nucleoside recognition membrane protein YjiH
MGQVGTLRFVVSAVVGLSFFLLPVPWGDRLTVPFDVAVQWVTRTLPGTVAVYCLVLILIGGVGSVAASFDGRARSKWLEAYRGRARGKWLEGYRTSPMLLVLRLVGVPFAVIYLFQVGPDILLQEGVADLMWNTLTFSVAVIIPIGAALLGLLVRYGFLEFVGTLMRPVMRPLFRLPGRSALDSLTSWVGSYSVGLYLTRSLTQGGYYNRREAYTIVTCFSTVSIGFVGVVAQTLGLLHLFPVIFITYFVAIYLLTAILVRMWPIKKVSEEYLSTPRPEAATREASGLLREAWERALRQAREATSFWRTLREGFVDGLMLASTILGSILAVGTTALLVARETPLFTVLGQPLVPLLTALGLPDAQLIGPATLVGITEMYIPALLVQDAAIPARFFIAVLSISQLIFFSAVGPMILDMFRDVPVRGRELVALFLLRTAMLIPLLALVTALLGWGGVLDGGG